MANCKKCKKEYERLEVKKIYETSFPIDFCSITCYAQSIMSKQDINEMIEKYHSLHEVKNAGELANVTYNMVQFLSKEEISEEFTHAMMLIHNMFTIPLISDFEKTHKFVAGWIEK